MTSYRTYPLSNEFHLRSVGLSKVAGCRRKSPPTWLVSAGYSAWHFFTGSVFFKKYPWTGHLLWQLSRPLQNILTTLMWRRELFQAEGFDLPVTNPRSCCVRVLLFWRKNTEKNSWWEFLSPIQDYVHPDDDTQPSYEMTLEFKPFTGNISVASLTRSLRRHVQGIHLRTNNAILGKCLFRKFNRATKDANLVDYE